MRPVAAADFEAEKIGPRPKEYPPKPVGLALSGEGVKECYLSWGHPSGNNSSPGEAKGLLRKLYKTHRIVFHNAPFDCEVAHEHLGLPFVPEEYDDTLFLAFLIDPRSEELGLKPLAERWLGMKPRERDKLKEWIIANVKEAKDTDRGDYAWGGYISRAPASLVSPYAIGDTRRTYKLFKVLSKKMDEMDKRWPPEEGQQSMRQAYQREITLMPTLMRMERQGIALNIRQLERDIPQWRAEQKKLDQWIIKRLGGARRVAEFAKEDEEFNIGSNSQLANALDAAGKVSHWIETDKGNRSTAKKALEQVITDKLLLEAIQRRNIYDTYLGTYGQKWLDTHHNGLVFPRINQVRNYERDNNAAGARTGRLSYSDSWQAIPSPERRPFQDLPNLREYVVPHEKGKVIAVRDYSQQEYRILANYEDGPLLARYQANPFIDMHEEARQMIFELTHKLYDRRPVKDTGFGQIYGLGLASLSERLKIDAAATKELKIAYLQAIPGLPKLMKEIKDRCRRGEPIRTWGGRLYWVEPPSFSRRFNKVMSYEYKMLNVLIQGSAADNTKEAMIRADEALPADIPMFIQVHDELGIEPPREKLDRGMKLLREAMESVEFDVKMLSDGKWSPRSWGSVKKYNDKR